MPTVHCPECQASYDVLEASAQPGLRCENCRALVTIGPPTFVPSAPEPMPAPPSTASNGGVTAAGVFAIVGGLLILMMGGWMVANLVYNSYREEARKKLCVINLRQIWLGLEGYHKHYGRFPPAYSTDATGRPLLSWRVLILPFIEQQLLYKQFRLDEPWDSDHNRRLANIEIDLFHCASAYPHKEGETHYFAVVTETSAIAVGNSATIDEVCDGTSNTVIVVESSKSVPWTAPDDLSLREFVEEYSGEGKLASHHAGGATVLLADGSTIFVTYGKFDRKALEYLVDRCDRHILKESKCIGPPPPAPPGHPTPIEPTLTPMPARD